MQKGVQGLGGNLDGGRGWTCDLKQGCRGFGYTRGLWPGAGGYCMGGVGVQSADSGQEALTLRQAPWLLWFYMLLRVASCWVHCVFFWMVCPLGEGGSGSLRAAYTRKHHTCSSHWPICSQWEAVRTVWGWGQDVDRLSTPPSLYPRGRHCTRMHAGPTSGQLWAACGAVAAREPACLRGLLACGLDPRLCLDYGEDLKEDMQIPAELSKVKVV